MHAEVGDEIVVDSMEVGGSTRRGKIVAVKGEAGSEHYEVEWSDGHTSIFFPGSTAHTLHKAK